jgi:hypothetical protein
MKIMVYRIVQYIQPWEIDDFERQIDQLIKSSYFLDSSDKVIIDCTMNLDIVDWSKSKLPSDYFTNKFNYLSTKANRKFIIEFDTDSSIMGVTDKRRSIQEKNQDYIIWLDSDLYFSIYTLSYLIQASKQIENSVYILSPQIIKYWDSSWDSIVADKYLSMPFNHRDFFDSYSLDLDSKESVNIKINNSGVKFGGGWFNLFTDNLLKEIPLHSKIGSYGPDDTYLMYCALHKKIPQYILENIIVTEAGNLYLENKDYIKPLLHSKIQDKQRISDTELFQLIQDFITKQ